MTADNMSDDRWTFSINEFPLHFRAQYGTYRITSMRRQGILKEGIHFETIENAEAKKLNIVGKTNRRPSGSKFVYNISRTVAAFEERFHV